MTDAQVGPKFERSPSFPFISLRKAEERARQFWDKHRKEAARLAAVGPTWGYAAKSSGLQQTVGALKQFGLMEDSGIGDERKVQLTELGRRLVADQRDGARMEALKEAAMRPRLFQEYRRWIVDPPSQSHCLSELELDRGFNPAAAHAFLRAFIDTVSFADLKADIADSSDEARAEAPQRASSSSDTTAGSADGTGSQAGEPEGPFITPLGNRLKLSVTVGSVSIQASLVDQAEIDMVIRFLEANKVLLPPAS